MLTHTHTPRLKATSLTQMASCPLMRARKKYSVKEVLRLEEQTVIHQAENHSSFAGEHVKVKVVCESETLTLSALR